MTARVALEVLEIKSCSDPRRWYAPLVGRRVPNLGYDPVSGWRSKEPDGLTNFVMSHEAERVAIFVPADKLGQWPFITHKTLAVQARAKSAQASTGANPCAGFCTEMGICQAMEHCQDAPRIKAELNKPVAGMPEHTGQSRRASLVESVVNLVIGFVVGVLITAVVMPWYGHAVTLEHNLQITAIFTVASLVRSYLLRRLFNFFDVERT